MHPIPKWVANASNTQMRCKCIHYPNELQMHPIPKCLPNASNTQMTPKCLHYPNDCQYDSYYPNDLWSIRFLLISFNKKQFYIVVTFHFWSNPQYRIVRGMVLKQLNNNQLLTNSQSQGYITSVTIILMKTMHVLCIIGGDLIYAFLLIHEYATIHALYWSKFWKNHIMLV